MKFGIYGWHFPKDERNICVGEFNLNSYESLTTVEEKGKKRIKDELGKKGTYDEQPVIDFIIEADFKKEKKSHYDTEVHKTLTDYFGNSVKNGEWIKLDRKYKDPIKIIKAAIIATANQTAFDPDRPDYFPLRKDSQDIAVEKIKLCYNSGIKKFLLGAKCRFGKTFTSYKAALEIKADTILIMTFRPTDTRDAWRNDLNSHQDFKGYNFYTVKDLEAFKQDVSKKVLFLSFQKITQALSKDNYELYDFLKSVNFDMLIIDEDQIGAHRQENRELVAKINPKFELVVTGTPELEIISNEFEKNFYKFDYIDEQLLKEKYRKTGDVLYKDYDSMPQLSLYAFDLSKRFADTFTDKDGFQLSKFFSVKDDGVFEYHAYVKKFLDYLSMTCDDASLDLDEAFGIFASDRKLDHGLWKLPSIKACKALQSLLASHPYFKDYYVEVLPESDKSPDKIENTCKKYPKTIWLTVMKNTVGVTVKSWTYTMSLYGSDSSSLSTYIQYIFRAGSPGKEEFYSFDFCPSRVLNVVDDFAQAHASSSTKQSYDAALRQVLNYLPVYAYNKAGTWDKLDNAELFRQMADFTTFRSCRNLLLEEFTDLAEYADDVANVQVDSLNPQITKNEALKKLKKELAKKPAKKGEKKERELSDKDFIEKVYQAFIDIYSWVKYYFNKVDDVNDLINKIKTWENDYEKVFGFSKDFMVAMIAVINASQKKFGIAIERFSNIAFKFAMEDVPEELAYKMLNKFSDKKDGETICDWYCKGPTLLLCAAKYNPTAKLYARIIDGDLRTELILKKELKQVNIIKGKLI